MPHVSRLLIAVCFLLVTSRAGAQPVPPEHGPQIRADLKQLQTDVAELRADKKIRQHHLADVAVFAKGVEWALRHNEFTTRNDKPTPFVGYATNALKIGRERAAQLKDGQTPWESSTERTILGYFSKVDGSVQPYAIGLPEGVDPRDGKRWPLHIKLHGRGGRNELRFFNDHYGKPLEQDQDWIQIDVFGRIDNAYRFAGEADVFEALADVKRRFRIDEKRITLWGFSMGGAGAWHLGVHHPALWSSVGPGAGFVDFYEYQKQTEKRPPWQHKTLHIYDALDYASNAFNVPICTYGGELDAQLVASTRMVDAAKKRNVPIKLIIGPGMGHKFDPKSFETFMAFHREKSAKGRPGFPGSKEIRFITYTPKYNTCEWLTVEELTKIYEPATVEAKIDTERNVLKVTTTNVSALQISRDVAETIELDGESFPLRSAADSLLPGVYYERENSKWRVLDYDESRAFQDNTLLHKRRNLQGPIDDAFMQPFVCVRGTGTAWSPAHQAWTDWTLDRFDREFDKWMRGKIQITNDSKVDDELIADKNLILFGDPGSNAVLARVLPMLPISWTKDKLTVNGQDYDIDTHGLSMIFPNPLNPSRYIVINSGHTFHEPDFKASNSWLFPRLGDIAVQKFQKNGDGYDEETVWAEIFNGEWRLP